MRSAKRNLHSEVAPAEVGYVIVSQSEGERTVENCIFCMIGRGDLVASKVYEDDQVVAFDDIAPQAPVHVLIVPKKHYASMSDKVPLQLMASLFAVVPEVAKAKGIEETGYREIVNNGREANQTVGHLHVHVLGGRPPSHGMVHFGG